MSRANKSEYWEARRLYDLKSYKERRKLDVVITVDAYDIWTAATEMADRMNQTDIRQVMGMSGRVTVDQVAAALAEFLPGWLTSLVETRMGDLEHYLSDETSRVTGPLDEALVAAGGLVHAQYEAWQSDESGSWFVGENVRVAAGEWNTLLFPYLGVFEDEADAQAMTHKWNRAFDWVWSKGKCLVEGESNV